MERTGTGAQSMLAWHFLPDTRQLRTGEIVEAGQSYTAQGPLILCENGMHASWRALDALMYAPGPVVCRVRLLGEMLHDTDKTVARTRQVLWLADATRLLHEFALSVATDALCLTDTTDPRSWTALQVKLRWLRGHATDQALAAARDAAWYAAGAAARNAAKNAAGAAWDAAGAAAMNAAKNAAWAAWDAAGAAGKDAAWAAAKDAAWAWAATKDVDKDAAWAAAKDAAWDAYNVQLETMLENLQWTNSN